MPTVRKTPKSEPTASTQGQNVTVVVSSQRTHHRQYPRDSQSNFGRRHHYNRRYISRARQHDAKTRCKMVSRLQDLYQDELAHPSIPWTGRPMITRIMGTSLQVYKYGNSHIPYPRHGVKSNKIGRKLRPATGTKNSMV